MLWLMTMGRRLNGVYAAFMLVAFMMGVAGALQAPTLSLFLSREVGAQPFWVGLFYTVNAIAGILVSLALAKRSDSRGDRRRLIMLCCLMAVGNALLQVMPLDKDNPFTSFLALTGITSALNFIMTANGVPALYTTFAQSFADATGFPLLSVIMIQVLGYSTPLLPYQASPIVVAMGLGKVPARAGMQLCLALAAVSYLILLPLDYAWYQLLGKL